ncbi:unnamed protein product [Musa hybrid cultivar]
MWIVAVSGLRHRPLFNTTHRCQSKPINSGQRAPTYCMADVRNHGLTMVQLLLTASFLLPPPVVTTPTLQGREKKCEQFDEWAPIDAELHTPCFLGLLFAFILADCSADVKHI